MESWSYASPQGNKGFVSNGSLSSPDVLARTRNMIMGWNLSDLLAPDHRSGEDVRSFREVGLPEPPPKHLQSADSIRDGLSFKAGGSSYGSSSASVMRSSSMDSFIDLKLGRLADQKGAQSSNAVPKFSPPPKKARMANLNPQAPPLCQVHGCNKDLTSSKEYHKRHRVCKDHSISPRVIVNGFEQRFCQQCSRFHLLAEFDNGKRSCRKRLAGHNERRRKPQLGIPGRGGRFLPSYNGFDRNALCGTASGSFICQDILNNGLLYPKTIGASSCWSGRRIKLEPAAADFGRAAAYAHPLDTQHSSSLFHDHDDFAAGSFFIESVNRHPHEEPRLVPRALLHFGGEDLVSYSTTPSSFQGFPGIADSSCALSLLSSQPQKNSLSGHLPGIPVANNHSNSITGLADDPHHGAGQIFDEAASFSSPGMMASAAAKTHLGSGGFVPQGHGVAGFEVVADGLFHGTDLVHAKERFSCQDGATIDLLQLSSQLHRVEQQRQEDDAFCCLRIT